MDGAVFVAEDCSVFKSIYKPETLMQQLHSEQQAASRTESLKKRICSGSEKLKSPRMTCHVGYLIQHFIEGQRHTFGLCWPKRQIYDTHDSRIDTHICEVV